MPEFKMEEYLAGLPLPPARAQATPMEVEDAVPDIQSLPKGVAVGTNLIGFEDSVSPAVREGVSLSLMAAQQVADGDKVVNTPDLWVERHDMVLKGLGWVGSQGGVVTWSASARNVSVHEAIIPLLSSAFGGLAVGGLIIAALEKLNEMDEAPWITLFERETRRLDVTEFRFGVIEQIATGVTLRLAAARLIAEERRLQILFFKSRSNEVQLQTAQAAFAVHERSLEQIVSGLRPRLEASVSDFIRELPL